jgi:hypothetical protein
MLNSYDERTVPVRLLCFRLLPRHSGVRGGVVVEALRYKPKSRGFDSQWCHWIFSLT